MIGNSAFNVSATDLEMTKIGTIDILQHRWENGGGGAEEARVPLLPPL